MRASKVERSAIVQQNKTDYIRHSIGSCLDSAIIYAWSGKQMIESVCKPYKSYVATICAKEVVFYIPKSDLDETLDDPNMKKLFQCEYLIQPIQQTIVDWCNSDLALVKFRFLVWDCDWCEFDNQPYIQDLKEHLTYLGRKYRNSGHREAGD